MNAYHTLMTYREDFEGHYWNQMVQVNNPKRESKASRWEERILNEIRVAMEFALATKNTGVQRCIEKVCEELLNQKQ